VNKTISYEVVQYTSGGWTVRRTVTTDYCRASSASAAWDLVRRFELADKAEKAAS
jgi:hypothetical protein